MTSPTPSTPSPSRSVEPVGLDIERLRGAIYAVSVRHDWANTTDTEDRTEEIVAEYAAQPALGLDAAWAEAEAALPKGWYISNVRRRSPNSRYSASATLGYSDTGESMSGFGPTAADALRALALRLSSPPFTTGAPVRAALTQP